jgi:uncharacterized RDD family membrane protein YckC
MASAAAPPSDPTDVVGRRAAAFLTDAILLAVVGLVLFAALRYRSYSNVQVDACTILRKGAGKPLCLKVGSHVFLWHVGALKTAVGVTLFLGFLNGVVLQSILGSSVGKICYRLSVVDENGRKPHPLRMFGRWVFLVVDVGFCFVGCFMVAATHPHRRIGDFVFGTYVVALRSVGRPVNDASAGDASATTGVGVPSNWTAPPVPTAANASAALSPRLQTPPGTAPTAPGEWGAVARPAPVVRSPQWATPPPSDSGAPPAVIESASSPKWAAPPVHEPEPEAEAEPETGADTEDAAETESETEPQPETAAEAADTAEPEVESDTESEQEQEPEAEPELSEWSPVASSRRSRGAKAAASDSKDASWWDAALSSGDSDAEAEEELER